MENNLKIAKAHSFLATFYAVVSLLFLVFCFIPSNTINNNDDVNFGLISIFIFIVFLCFLHLLIYKGAIDRKLWANNASIAVAVLMLLGFPIGTMIGIYLLSNSRDWKIENSNKEIYVKNPNSYPLDIKIFVVSIFIGFLIKSPSTLLPLFMEWSWGGFLNSHIYNFSILILYILIAASLIILFLEAKGIILIFSLCCTLTIVGVISKYYGFWLDYLLKSEWLPTEIRLQFIPLAAYCYVIIRVYIRENIANKHSSSASEQS